MSLDTAPLYHSLPHSPPFSPALNVATPRGPRASSDEPLSPQKAEAVRRADEHFAEILPAGVAQPRPAPVDDRAPSLLKWLTGLFDSIRRHIHHEAAAGNCAHADAVEAETAVKETEAEVSECVCQHATHTERSFAQRLSSLLGDLASRLKHWLRREEATPTTGPGAAQADEILHQRNIAQWKAGMITGHDMVWLASDHRLLHAALQRLPNVVKLRDERGNTLAHVIAGGGAFAGEHADPPTIDHSLVNAREASNLLASAAGVDLSLVNAQGDSPLHVAAALANPPISAQVVLPALLRRAVTDGVDLGRHNAAGMTVLQQAVATGCPEAIDALLAIENIDLDALSRDGGTALCLALSSERFDIAQKLLDAGADGRHGHIDNLPPAIWLRQTIGSAMRLQHEYRNAGDLQGAEAVQAFVDEGRKVLDAIARQRIPVGALR